MLKDPFEYETCSKEWYRAIYDIGRYFLLLCMLDTCILFLANATLSLENSTLATDSWITQFNSNILFPFFQAFAPCHMLPVFVYKTILSVQIYPQNRFYITFLLIAVSVLMLFHLIAYIASKKKFSWMQFEAFTLIIDAVCILSFAYLEKTIGIGTLIRIMFHILYIFSIRFAAQCGNKAYNMESHKCDKANEVIHDDK